MKHGYIETESAVDCWAQVRCCLASVMGYICRAQPVFREKRLSVSWDSECSTTAPSDASSDADSMHTLDGRHSLTFLPRFQRPSENAQPPLILFDWDDSLFPTSHIRNLPMSKNGDIDVPLGECVALAGIVRDVLRAARAVGRVAIVTLAERPWVPQSAAMLMPELELETLLYELDISVYYATEHGTPVNIEATPGEKEEGYVALKRAAMSSCLQQAYPRRRASSVQRNVVSIGDSNIEKRALKEVLKQCDAAKMPPLQPLCKTVKLMDEPRLNDVARQLLSITPRLQSMVAQTTSFDNVM